MRRSAEQQPEPPRNIRVIDAEGREFPVSCIYDGEEDGFHVWTVVDLPAGVRIKTVLVEVFPPRTHIAFVRLPKGGNVV